MIIDSRLVGLKMTEEEKNLFGIDKLNVKRSTIPAVTHVDYSARVQTIHEKTNPKYYQLNCLYVLKNLIFLLVLRFIFCKIFLQQNKKLQILAQMLQRLHQIILLIKMILRIMTLSLFFE